MEKIFKFTEASVSKLKKNVNQDFDTVKDRYTLRGQGTFNLESDKLEILNGHYEIPIGIILIDDQTGKRDYENSRIIYEAFKNLSPADADDQRLWVYLTHITFFEYNKRRWSKDSVTERTVLSRFFYNGTGRGSRTHNGISRLWWTAHLTVRKDEVDEERKWELTKAIFDQQDLQVSLLERTMGSYENVRTAFLEFYLLNKDKMNGKMIQDLSRDLNNSGGVFILSLLSKDEVKQRLEQLLNFYLNN